MTGAKYEPGETFADGVEWCIACGLDLSQSDIMAMRVALQAARSFKAGLVVPERAMLPHNSLPMPWREEFDRIEQACGGGVPTIAELKRLLPVGAAAETTDALKPTRDKRGPKSGDQEWRADLASR